ncbi:GNAT family N-acetyltransferase [Kineococcus sp. SYSU DK004]|uniref:GNAT family N-acetyltransferase n=1 Tax=Kineococcus sp. SYSU DK004 TaxID=3383125 RepID=UPI003D7EC565
MPTTFAPEDLQDAAELFVRVFTGAPWNEPWRLDAARQRLADVLATPGAAGTCLREAGALVGFALGHVERSHSARHFLLKEMCVDAGRQRRGHGRALLTALVEGLDDVEEVYLVTASTGTARLFYESTGFRAAQHHGVMVKRVRAG